MSLSVGGELFSRIQRASFFNEKAVLSNEALSEVNGTLLVVFDEYCLREKFHSLS